MLLVLPLALSLQHPRPDEPGGDTPPPEPPPPLAPPEASPQAAAPAPAEAPQVCGRAGCTERPRWKPVLQLRPHQPVAEPMLIEVGMVVCDGHRGTFNDYVNEEGYRTIQEMFRNARRAKPVRHRCTVEHRLIEGA